MDDGQIEKNELETNNTPPGMEMNMREASSRTDNNATINTNGSGETATKSNELNKKLSHREGVNGNVSHHPNDTISASSQANNDASNAANGSGSADQNSTTVTTNTAQLPPPLIIDTHHPHRYGFPILPLLPLQTSDFQVPKRFSPTSTHLTTLRSIIAGTGIYLHSEPVIVHRHRAGQEPGKTTLTLLIQSDSSAKSSWPSVITAVHNYLHSVSLTLSYRNHRLQDRKRASTPSRSLSHDPLTSYITKKKVGIRKVLEEAGVEWASIEFWYRGTGKTRGECEAVVLIGGKVDERDEGEVGKWFGKEGVVEKVRQKMGGRMGGGGLLE